MVQTSRTLIHVGSLVGDQARAAMLMRLMDGRAQTASELAAVAGVSPQTASTHLRRLIDGGILSVVAQGRHRYHQLASSDVAAMLEGILRFSDPAPPSWPRTVAVDAGFLRARTCYRHLAGRYAVAIADHLLASGAIDAGDGSWQVTAAGAERLRMLGPPLAEVIERPARVRPERYCRGCLDCTERRPHLAGLVGEAMLHSFLQQDWLRRIEGRRELRVTPAGQQAFRRVFGLRD
ncbi:ArsR/SmtB family transcription factor [Stenotrophomonas maltophilia]|uniref:ArsR/SmtB family transcription factor n=1 Tax=Stenotrophomonas maltophilia TaxID=40324 RepID=UPI0034DB0207